MRQPTVMSAHCDQIPSPQFDISSRPRCDFLPTCARETPHSQAPANMQTRKQRSALQDVVTREYTINLHKRVHDLGFKKSEC